MLPSRLKFTCDVCERDIPARLATRSGEGSFEFGHGSHVFIRERDPEPSHGSNVHPDRLSSSTPETDSTGDGESDFDSSPDSSTSSTSGPPLDLLQTLRESPSHPHHLLSLAQQSAGNDDGESTGPTGEDDPASCSPHRQERPLLVGSITENDLLRPSNSHLVLCPSCSTHILETSDSAVEKAKLEKLLGESYRPTFVRLRDQIESEAAIVASREFDEEEEMRELDEQIDGLMLDIRQLGEEEKEEVRRRSGLMLREAELRDVEEKYWRAFVLVQEDSANLREEVRSVGRELGWLRNERARLERRELQYFRLRATPDGTFGTINGLRLGRTQETPVTWEENNAALGLCVLLLHVLADKIQYSFPMHELVPYASRSYIVHGTHEDEYPLYYEEGAPSSLRRFHAGMVHFLLCLKQFYDPLEERVFSDSQVVVSEEDRRRAAGSRGRRRRGSEVRRDSTEMLQRPRSRSFGPAFQKYVIEKTTIGGRYDVRYYNDRTTWGDWTRAMRKILITLKHFQKSVNDHVKRQSRQ